MLIFNEDPDSRFYRVEAGTMTEDKLFPLVDDLEGSLVKTFLVCTNAMKANFPSRVLQPFTDGFDANLGVDQPCMNGDISDWGYRRSANIQVLEKHGIDSNASLIKRAEEKGLRPGITVRMNDAHGLWLKRSLMMSKFYLDHPEYRIRKMYPMEPLDFSHEEVRAYMLRFIEEVLKRYDVPIIVTDWLRHPPYFDLGAGERNANLLTEMMREVKNIVSKAASERGHEIELWANVPSTIPLALKYGIDAVQWANENIVDRLILCPKYIRDMTISPDDWKQTLKNPTFPLSVRIENAYQPYPDDVMNNLILPDLKRTNKSNICFTRGAAWSAYCRGAESIEFFNYMSVRSTKECRPIFNDCASLETLKGKERWTMITYNDLDMDDFIFFKGWREPGYFSNWIEENIKTGKYPYQLPRRIAPNATETFSFPCGRILEPNAKVHIAFAGLSTKASVTFQGLPTIHNDTEWILHDCILNENDAKVKVTNLSDEDMFIREALMKVCFN